MTLATGSRLGPYEVKAPIGKGGMGEVYRARDTRLDRDIAIKILPDNVLASPKAIERFTREAKAVAALSHPGIVAIHDFGMDGRVFYAVTELLEGETLRERITEAPIAPRKAVELAVQIANGLASAHEKGIVHRDLKPENLFLTRDGHIKILDFGLAAWRVPDKPPAAGSENETQTRHSEPGMVVGTVGYMSPEQVRGKTIDHRTDIFALGCVLYEMLTGQRAFKRETSAETMTAILREEPPDFSTAERHIPLGLERLVRRCLEKRPEERVQSARDLGIALEAVSMGDSTTAAIAPIPSSRASRWTAVAALTIVAFSGLGWFVWTRASMTATVANAALPTFTQVTFRRGFVSAARFDQDSKSIIYSASWDSAPMRVFSTRAETARTSTAPILEGQLLGVSKTNELAVMVRPAVSLLSPLGTLARATLSGAPPREVLDGVQQAAWSPAGDLAIIRASGGHTKLESPIDRVKYESSGWLSSPRFSPDGNFIAFLEHPLDGDDRGWPAVVDLRSGEKRNLTEEWGSLTGLAWRPRSNEVCFGAARTIQCVSLEGGKARGVLSGPQRFLLDDISSDDRILARTAGLQGATRAGLAGGPEFDIDETAASMPIDIDPADGRVLYESIDYGVYVGTPGRRDAVRLAEGIPLGLSPDRKHVLVLGLAQPTRISLAPIGAGSTVELPSGPITQHTSAVFTPDGRRIVLSGAEKDHGSRLYVQDLAGGEPKPISAFGVRLPPFQPRLVSPDGALVAAIGPDQKISLFPLAGGEPQAVKGLEAGMRPIGWTERPHVLFVSPEAMTQRVPVFRHDVIAGTRELWREVGPSDPIGSPLTLRLQVTPDGKRYAYIYFLTVSELFVIDHVFDRGSTAPGTDPAR